MITKRELVVGLLAGFVGSVIGMSVNTASVAEEVAQGEVLTVCINKKTGAIKVANKCSKEERKTTLGGVGPQGAQGEKGDKGDTGQKGETGLRGEPGQTPKMNTKEITVWEKEQRWSLSGCTENGVPSRVTRVSVLNYETELKNDSFFGLRLIKDCTTLVGTRLQIYTP